MWEEKFGGGVGRGDADDAEYYTSRAEEYRETLIYRVFFCALVDSHVYNLSIYLSISHGEPLAHFPPESPPPY